VDLLGVKKTLKFKRDAAGLAVELPSDKPNDYAYAFRITQ
jgi:hypothetical protein